MFDFITPEVGAQIFDGMLRHVVNRVRDEHKVDLVVEPAVEQRLRELCTKDLGNGGRGIGNQLESRSSIRWRARCSASRSPAARRSR